MADEVAQLGFAVDSSQLEAASPALDRLTASSKTAEAAAGSFAAAQKAAATTSSGAGQALQAQVGALGQMGSALSQAATQADHFAVSARTMSRGQDIAEYGKELDRVRAQFNPLFAAGQQYKQQITEINNASRVGAISEKERADALMNTKVAFVEQVNSLRGVSAAYGDVGKSTEKFGTTVGLARHELVNLSRQAQDFAVSLGSGQSFGTVMLQQGTQVFDVLANTTGTMKGLFSQIVSGAASIFTPLRLVAGGVASIGAGALYAASNWGDAQRDIDRALIGIGQRSGATATDINKIATASTSAFGLSVSQARGAAIEFAKVGDIGTENIKAATDTVNNFAIAIGKDTTEAAKTLAQALSGDLVAGADALNAKLGFMDGKTRELISSLQNQNRTQEAQKIIIDGVNEATKRATETLGPYEKAWALLGNTLAYVRDKAGQALTGPSVDGQIKALEAQRGQLLAIGADKPGATGSGFLKAATDQLEKLTAAKEKDAAASADARFKQFSNEADAAVRAIIPQIEQIRQLDEALAKLNRTKEQGPSQATGGGSVGDEISSRQSQGDKNEAATAALRLQKQLLIEAAAEEQRRVAAVTELAKSYEGVSIEVAKGLEQQRGQLDVASAVTGQQRLAAQEAATYNELILQGKSSTEAALLAEGQRAIAQAEITSGAREQLFALENQAALAGAVTGQERIHAQELATINALLRQGVSVQLAMKIGVQQTANSYAQISAQAQNQLAALQAQEGVASARTVDARLAAQEEARYLDLLRQGLSTNQAMSIAVQERTNAEAQVTAAYEKQLAMATQITGAQKIAMMQLIGDWREANVAIAEANSTVERQIMSLRQQNDLIVARLNGTEATVRAEQAYVNAINSGASALQASELAEETRRNSKLQSIQSQAGGSSGGGGGFQSSGDARIDAEIAKYNAAEEARAQAYQTKAQTPKTTFVRTYDAGMAQAWDEMIAFQNSQKESAEKARQEAEQKAQSAMQQAQQDAESKAQQGIQQTKQDQDRLLQLQNQLALTQAPSDEARAHLQRDITYNEQLSGGSSPEFAAAIADLELTNTLADLAKRTADNTIATTANTASLSGLSPYYATDPRLSHLGFRPDSGKLDYDPFKLAPSGPPGPPALPFGSSTEAAQAVIAAMYQGAYQGASSGTATTTTAAVPAAAPILYAGGPVGDTFSTNPIYALTRSIVNSTQMTADQLTEMNRAWARAYMPGLTNSNISDVKADEIYSQDIKPNLVSVPSSLQRSAVSQDSPYFTAPALPPSGDTSAASRSTATSDTRPILINMSFNAPVDRGVAAELKQTVYQSLQASGRQVLSMSR